MTTMAMGIMDMIGLAASLVFALPLGMFGLRMLFDGRFLVGVGLLAIAIAMVVLPQYLTVTGPRKAIANRLGRLKGEK